jgi:hypothetical protein
MMFRRGVFASRVVIEVRADERQRQQAHFNVIAQGQPLTANVRLTYAHNQQHLQAASGDIPDFKNLQATLSMGFTVEKRGRIIETKT